jgi:hypothetical protein
MSTPQLQSSRGLLIWLLPIAALLAYAAHLTDYGQKLWPESIQWRKAAAPVNAAGVVPDIAFNADASPYAVVTDRNLFVPWRKPAPPAEPPPPPPEPPKPQIRRGVYALTGTMQIGSNVFATVKENATNRTKQVKVGDTLQEYSVKSVDADRIVLAYAGQEEELVLARYTQSGRATPPPAPVPVSAGQPALPGRQMGAPLAQPGGVPGGIPPRVAPPAAQPGGVPPFPPSGSTPVPPQYAPGTAQAQPVPSTPVAQPANPDVIDVGELLRRRREARKQ